MAHTVQQRKRIRQDAARYAANRSRRARVSSFISKFTAALTDPKAATEALAAAQSQLAKAAQKGALNKHAAARKASRLAARLKAALTRA